MSRKKHHTTKRRKRVGAMSLHHSSPLVTLGSLAVGYFFADTINPLIDKVIPTSIFPTPAAGASPTALGLNENTAAMAVELGIGGYLLLAKGQKSMVKTLSGGIIAGAGIKRALKATGIVSGYQSVPVIGRRRHVSGYQSVPVIGGNGTPPQLAGVPPMLQGFRVNGYTPVGSGAKVMGKVGALYNHSGVGTTSSGSDLIGCGGSDIMN